MLYDFYSIPLIVLTVLIFIITTYYLEKSDVCNIGLAAIVNDSSSFAFLLLITLLILVLITLLYNFYDFQSENTISSLLRLNSSSNDDVEEP